MPFKVFHAFELQDDYYLNILDWSVQNILAVGLGSAVYLWNASTCQVSRCTMPTQMPHPFIQASHMSLIGGGNLVCSLVELVRFVEVRLTGEVVYIICV